MSMKASEIILLLRKAIEEHGDLPCYTQDADIAKLEISPCVDGAEVRINGKLINPNEFYLEFVPK